MKNRARLSIILVALVLQVAMLTGLALAGPQDYQPRPIPMGVSVSNTPSLPYIYTGTAGMLVRSFEYPDIKFILSNNHVLGAIGPTLCPNTAPLWTWTLQPGTLDIGADPGYDPYYLVGAVVGWFPIDFTPGVDNYVDAALSWTIPELAKKEILDIGNPNPALGLASLGMAVKKSGRTTGVTSGTVESVNTTVNVCYGDETCSCGTARFAYQFIVTSGTGSFSAPGDSGSVVLESATNTPVGLLFAGSSTQTVCNHIWVVYFLSGTFVD